MLSVAKHPVIFRFFASLRMTLVDDLVYIVALCFYSYFFACIVCTVM